MTVRMWSTLLVCVGAFMPAATFAEDDDARLLAFFKTYLEASFQQRPLDATRLGDHRFDHLLDDISPEARAGWLKLARSTLEELPRTVRFDALTPAGKVDYDIFREELERNVWYLEELRSFETDARIYGDYAVDCVYSLLTQSTLPRETNIKNAIARMGQVPRLLRSARGVLKTPYRTPLETAIRQTRGSIGFYERDLFTLAGETSQAAELKTATVPVLAALADHLKFLESLQPHATDNWRLGKEKFAKKFDLTMSAGISADETLADAEAEYVRVRNEMYVIARQLWHRYAGRTPLPPMDEAGRRQTIAAVIKAVANEHGSPEALVHDAAATVNRIQAFIRERDILRLPEPDRCQVIEMPEFRRGNSIAYLEPALPLDPDGASYYAISPPPADWGPDRVRSFLEEYNRHMLQILTIHEAYPGHYVQLEYSNREPSLIRKVLQSGVFAEGWAVYTEQMMLDEGYGGGDLALRLNQLKFYLRAVVNTILDYKMHCTDFSDDQAFELLTEGAFQADGEARLKIIRAKQSSVQLCTYFVGRMAFVRLRDEIQREQGGEFSLGRYHEAVLDHGTIPMKHLPQLVRQRLAEPR